MYRRKNNKHLFIIFIFFSIAVVLGFFSSYHYLFRSSVLELTHPTQNFLVRSGSNFFKSINILRNTAQVREELRYLHRQNNRYLAQIASLQSLKKENDELRQALGIFSEKEESYQIATITGRLLSVHEIVVFHNKPSFVGDAVITPDKVIVGFIAETNDRFSTVRLLTSPHSSAKARVQNDDSPVGVLSGNGSRFLTVDTVAKDKELNNGNLVTIIQYQDKIFSDIYVGRVVEVNNLAVEAFQSAVVSQGVDIKDVNYLIIISNDR